MKYFNNITSLDELKKAYRRLAMKYHPDCGGSDEIMKQINAEHDALFETLKASHNKTADEYHQTTETAEEFRDIVNALLKLDGLEIDPCIPADWTGYTVSRRFRGAVYHITVENPTGVQKGVKQLLVNGQSISGTVIPAAATGSIVEVRAVMG